MANESILTYEVFTAKQGFLQTEVTFEKNKFNYLLKLSIDKDENRTYTFSNGKKFAVHDKFFTKTANIIEKISENEQFQIMPKNQKVEVGAEWELTRSGYTSFCGSWTGKYISKVKEGPETLISIDGKDSKVKTLAIEINADVLQGNPSCSTLVVNRILHYSPELNEIVMDQVIDLEHKKVLTGGNKMVLKSITTKAGQAAK